MKRSRTKKNEKGWHSQITSFFFSWSCVWKEVRTLIHICLPPVCVARPFATRGAAINLANSWDGFSDCFSLFLQLFINPVSGFPRSALRASQTAVKLLSHARFVWLNARKEFFWKLTCWCYLCIFRSFAITESLNFAVVWLIAECTKQHKVT